VRSLFAASLSLLAALSCARAQDQESKLIDRLLKPDMTLQSSAQNKKFVADRTSISKQATVGTFYVQKRSNSKSFYGMRDFFTRQFVSHSYSGQRTASGISSHQPIGNSRPAYAAQSARGPRDAFESEKKVASRSYADNRPFLDQGKSQKSLTRKNKPLTIDEVRELLNKNK
jgi:opacity protein-like surface antigen